MTPTARTLKMLKDEGYSAEVVEKWLPHARIRKDLWGFIDLLAMKPGESVIGIQATSGSNVGARVSKIRDNPLHQVWLSTGCRIQVIGWRKICRVVNGRKTKQKVWRPLIREIGGDHGGMAEDA